MTSLLLTVLPLALGAAVSPMLFGIEVLALTSKEHSRIRGWMVALGAFSLLIAFTALVVVLGSSLPTEHPHPHIDAAIDLTAAVALAILAGRTLLRSRHPRPTKTPGLTDRLATASTAQFFVAGMAAMVLNASSLVLFVPALRAITRSHAGIDATITCFVVLVVITLITVWLPVGAVTVLGHRADPALRAMGGFMDRHAAAITIVIEFVFIVYLTIKGAGELL